MASQPSRALLGFCLHNKIPHKCQFVRLAKGDNLKPEYLKIHPQGKVPAIKDGDFALVESHAILRYLCATRRDLVADHWYPADAHKRAIVDQYLDWHHNNLRLGSGPLVFFTTFAKMMGVQEASPKEIAQWRVLLSKSLDMMEKWLSKSKYLCGDQISIADLSAVHELEQTKFINYDLSKWPAVMAWQKKVVDDDPTQLKVAKPMRKLAEKAMAKAKL